MKTVMLSFSKQAAGFLLLLISLYYLLTQVETGKYYSIQNHQSEKLAGKINVSGDQEFEQIQDGKVSSFVTEYNIGTGIAKVTDPATGLGMQGMSEASQKTTAVESHLYSRAFIIEHATTKRRVVLLNADIWSCTHAIKKEIVGRLQAAYGNIYTMENVLISGTHNHSGPGGFSHNYLYNHSIGGFDPHNFECIVSGMVLSIKKAHTALGPGRIYINKGEVPDCGRNRSPAAYNNNPAEERNKYNSNTDKEMLLLKFVKVTNTSETPVGVLNWYGIHPTNRGSKNTRVCGDNKGYASFLFEDMMRKNYPGKEPFVAAFANASAGDVSGNVEFGKIPDGVSDKKNMEAHGKRQFDKAWELYLTASEELRGDLEYRHRFVDMVSSTGTPGALGLSMFAGSTEDSNPGSGLKEGITEGNVAVGERTVQVAIAAAFYNISGVPCATAANLSTIQAAVHWPKPITLVPGVSKPLINWNKPVPLVPTILPVQLFCIGQLAVTGIPAEFTTMSGRRLKAAMLNDLSSIGATHAALNTYANDYSGYVTTEEEYRMQHYEGASTLFGPQTLNVYITEFKELAKAIKNKTTVAVGPNPPSLSIKKIPRITIRNLSKSKQTLYFYNHDDVLLFIEFSKKIIPANGEIAMDLRRPNNELIAGGRTKAKVVLNGNRKLIPVVSNNMLIMITEKGSLRVTAYTPPPR